jgi:GTP pyrophosphokinase
LGDALSYAADLHASQVRKGTNTPYLAHLLAVCSLILEAGGDEDTAIAGLLHDAVEDQGGADTAIEIERRFGPSVARIVADCSDTNVDPKPPWAERKRAHLAHLETVGTDSLLVAVADKFHNARCLNNDLAVMGLAVYDRFKGGINGTLWYYRAMLGLFERRLPECLLIGDYAAAVEEIEDVTRYLRELEPSAEGENPVLGVRDGRLIDYRLELLSGVHVRLTSLSQSDTPGPLDGAPTREMNERLVRDLVERYSAGTTGIVVIEPHIEVIRSDWRGPEAEGPTRLPSVFVQSTFTSGTSVGPDAADSWEGSYLKILWFQDGWALPIDPTIENAIIALDWSSLAVPDGIST